MDFEKYHKLDIILLCGLYGSRKTEFSETYFKNKNRNCISRTKIRELIFEMTHFGKKWISDYFTEEDDILIKHIERKILEHYIHNQRKVLLINTFISKKSRKRFIQIAKKSSRSIGIIFLDIPLDKCLKQNAENQNNISGGVISNLNTKKELPGLKEGFDNVLIVKDF